MHYFGQIRFPQGVYHAVWDGVTWSEPEMVYLLRKSPEESFGDNVEAHMTLPAVHAGNRLVLSFTDGPAHENRQLYTTTRLLADIPPDNIDPIPTVENQYRSRRDSFS